jgi:hypothetical protein
VLRNSLAKPHMIAIALARDEEVVDMREHRELRTIVIRLVEHARVIWVGDDSMVSRSRVNTCVP